MSLCIFTFNGSLQNTLVHPAFFTKQYFLVLLLAVRPFHIINFHVLNLICKMGDNKNIYLMGLL